MVGSSTLPLPVNNSVDLWSPIPYHVESRSVENRDLVTFRLAPASESAIEPISPGQFNMLYAFGIGEIPISISRIRQEHPMLEHTIQDVGPVSKALVQLSIGDIVGVRGPFGTKWPIEKAIDKDVLIISGGVGLCPLRPVVEYIQDHRVNFGKVSLLFGTRHPGNIIYHTDISSWQKDPSIDFKITVDHAFSNWGGNVGVVTDLIEKVNVDPANTVAFLCGPEVMMRFGIYACVDEGIPEENIFLSMERNMKCAVGFCGHCQLGPYFVCKDGAVFPYPLMKPYLT